VNGSSVWKPMTQVDILQKLVCFEQTTLLLWGTTLNMSIKLQDFAWSEPCQCTVVPGRYPTSSWVQLPSRQTQVSIRQVTPEQYRYNMLKPDAVMCGPHTNVHVERRAAFEWSTSVWIFFKKANGFLPVQKSKEVFTIV
jgi:hypothetical protein